jgi:hypothetical protein
MELTIGIFTNNKVFSTRQSLDAPYTIYIKVIINRGNLSEYF